MWPKEERFSFDRIERGRRSANEDGLGQCRRKLSEDEDNGQHGGSEEVKALPAGLLQGDDWRQAVRRGSAEGIRTY